MATWIQAQKQLLHKVTVSHNARYNYIIYAMVNIADAAVRNEMITVPEGTVRFGKPVDFPSYGWDNEYGQVEMK